MADSQQSRLKDSQDSLATALARLEAHRSRERILFRENQALRGALLQNGVSPAELQNLVRSPASAAKEDDDPHLWQGPACPGAAGDVLCPTPQVDEHRVHYLITNAKGQMMRTAGRVLVTDESLEFVQRVAHITPTEFLGIRALPAMPALAEMSGSTTWGERTRQGASAGAGVLSETAAWLLQRVRRSTSGNGGLQAAAEPEPEIANTASASVEETPTSEYAHLPSISSIYRVRTILNSKEEEEEEEDVDDEESESSCEDEAEAAESDAAPGWGPAYDVGSEPGSVLWEVLWKDGGGEGQLRRLKFEGQASAQDSLQQHMKRATETWSLSPSNAQELQEALPGLEIHNVSSLLAKDAVLRQRLISCSGDGSSKDGSLKLAGLAALKLDLAEPRHLTAAAFLPHLSEASSILTDVQLSALASALPARHQLSHWILYYSSARHGISLQTMYRRTLSGPSVLVVRDSGGYIFGCFTPLPWKPSPRYYGTGETFVFQLQPHMVAWEWKRSKDQRNDFFMFSTAQSLGVGGGGHFALFLDGDLLHGTSGCSQTFGNPCLASNDDFAVGKVELWGLA